MYIDSRGSRWHTLDEKNRDKRSELVIRLGGRCVTCSSVLFLEFHHLSGKTWIASEMSQSKRLKNYEEDIERGAVVLLCKGCHQDPYRHPVLCFCRWCTSSTM